MDNFTCPSLLYFTLLLFWASLLGIPKTLGIWVRGYPKLGDTQITVTPPLPISKGKTLRTKLLVFMQTTGVTEIEKSTRTLLLIRNLVYHSQMCYYNTYLYVKVIGNTIFLHIIRMTTIFYYYTLKSQSADNSGYFVSYRSWSHSYKVTC